MEQQELHNIKQRFGIIGNSPLLNRDIEVAVQVAPTDLSVLITGESGVGKENFACGKLPVKSIFEKFSFFERFSLLHKLVKFVYFFRKRLDK